MPSLVVSQQDDVLLLTLNRPEALNAFTVELHEQLRAALKDARRPEVRAVVAPARAAPSAPARTWPRSRSRRTCPSRSA